MKLLTPNQIAQLTGLPYGKALALIKELNHVQINNRYYVSYNVLKAFLEPKDAIKVTIEA